MNQVEQLYNLLMWNGSVTGLDCVQEGIMNYKGRIHDLRKLGVTIETKWETKVNAKGEKKTYARYYIV